MMYQALDWFFMVFHSLLIVFNLFGWILKPLRRANLITLLLTGLSWFGLGLIYGMGYCPLTDWHWRVLYELGTPPQTASYVAYLFDRIVGVKISGNFADKLTLVCYFAALIISVIYNVVDWIKKRKSTNFG
jgi:hypothetical protein